MRISEIDSKQLISYGSRSDIKSIYYCSIEELNDSFKSSKILTDPIHKNIIPKYALDKLFKLIKDNMDVFIFKDLNETINDLLSTDNIISIINMEL